LANPNQLVEEHAEQFIVEQPDASVGFENEPVTRMAPMAQAVSGEAGANRHALDDAPISAAADLPEQVQSSAVAAPAAVDLRPSAAPAPAITSVSSDATSVTPQQNRTADVGNVQGDARQVFVQQIEQAKQAVVTMDFSDNCWIEIRDRSGSVNVKQLVMEGQRLVRSGEPPFNIKIGNGDAVQLTYNGVPISLESGQRRGRVVVMTLGDEN
jgi:cytoskeleton protein RodZ